MRVRDASLGRNWRGLRLFSFGLFSLDLQRLSGHFGLWAVRILVDDALEHHARLLLIFELAVRLSDLERGRRQFWTERIIGDDVVEGLQCLFVPPHAVLAFPDPI